MSKKNIDNNESLEDNDDITVVDEELSELDLIKKLRKNIKRCEKERAEYLLGWQRSRADFVNAKKENEKGNSQTVKRAIFDTVEQLLPVLDSFHMALPGNYKEQKEKNEWQIGLENIHTQLKKILADMGVEEITPEVGSSFDPKIHDSVAQMRVDQKNLDNTVCSTLQKGYRIDDKIIRPARIQVGKYTQKA